MIRTKVDDYLNWLMGIVVDEDHQGYSRLLYHLYEIEFYWSVKKDENRAADGIHLRMIFEDQFGYSVKSLDDPCSVLEMLVALSVRAAEDILWDGETNWTPYLFWTMIDNLDLTEYVNHNYEEPEIDSKIKIFLDRKYDENGSGSLFKRSQIRSHFSNRSPKKWGKMEIWYQCSEWIKENFL